MLCRSLLVVFLCCLVASPVLAESSSPQGEAVHAITEISQNDLRLLHPTTELTRSTSRVLHWGGGHFVHVEQTLDGMPVAGGRIVMAYDHDASLRAIHGDTELRAPLSTTPSVPIETALALSAELAADLGDGVLWPPRHELSLVRVGSRTHLAWAIDRSIRAPLSAFRFYIDAHNGGLLRTEQRLFTAQGEVYPSNPVSSELTEVTLNDVDEDSLSNDYAYVKSCSDFNNQTWICNAKESQATPDTEGNYFFDPDALGSPDPFSELQMFFHLDLVARWFETEFGFRTDFGLAGDAVEGLVNFPLQNAFYGDADGDGLPEVAFGEGGGVDYAYDADVVYHEFGHAVFGTVVEAGSGRFDEYGRVSGPSALNEGSADLFSLAITGDSSLGEYAGASALGSGAIRDLEDDRHCPTDIFGESHVDGEIWGAFGWNVIDDPILGSQIAAHLVFGALNSWGDEVTWQIAGESLLEANDALLDSDFIDEGQHAALLAHIEAAGLDDCGRVVRLDEDQRPTQLIRARRTQSGEARASSLYTQFSLDAPVGAERLRFFVEDLNYDDPNGAYRVYVRRGQYVHHDLEDVETPNGTFQFASVADYDFLVDGSEEGVVVELTEDSEPPLEPGATYFFAVAGYPGEKLEGRANGTITLRGTAEINEPEVEDDDDLAGDGDGSGCTACSSVASRVSSLAWSLALALCGAVALRRPSRLG